MKRQVFYSFYYDGDSTRAAQVRNIGVIEGNRPATDNHWETVKRGGDGAIRKWIQGEMQYRSCTVVLVGGYTANRKWINYEIEESWKAGKGVVGICIHGLRDLNRSTSFMGKNPFDFVTTKRLGITCRLSEIVKWYDPPGYDSRAKYSWIAQNLSAAVEEAINIRTNHRFWA